jgi:hypothetical protein
MGKGSIMLVILVLILSVSITTKFLLGYSAFWWHLTGFNFWWEGIHVTVKCCVIKVLILGVPVPVNNMQASLMFIPCIIRHIRKNQQYALICTTPLFYVLAATCFGSSLPSSGSVFDPYELPEIQIEWVVYPKYFGYITDKKNRYV